MLQLCRGVERHHNQKRVIQMNHFAPSAALEVHVQEEAAHAVFPAAIPTQPSQYACRKSRDGCMRGDEHVIGTSCQAPFVQQSGIHVPQGIINRPFYR